MPGGRPRKPAGSKESLLQKARENPLATFPRKFFEIIEDYAVGKMPGPIVCADRNQAINVRHRFHTFRKLAIAQGGIKGAAESTGLYVRVDGNVVLFMGLPADLVLPELKQELDTRFAADRPIERPGIVPQVGGDQSPGELATEAWLGKGKQVPKPDTSGLDIPALDASTTGELIPPCPPHEADLSDSYCIKCKLPKFQWDQAK